MTFEEFARRTRTDLWVVKKWADLGWLKTERRFRIGPRRVERETAARLVAFQTAREEWNGPANKR